MGKTDEQSQPSVVSGGAAVAVSRVVRQGAQLVVFIVGARILGPADFGLFALVSAFAALASILAQGGWSGFIMGWRGADAVVREELLVTLLAALLVAGAGAGAALLAALVWTAEVRDLMLLFAVWIFLAANAEAQSAVLVHQHRLAWSAACQIAGEIVGMVVALWQLAAGAGVFALVYGRMAAQTIELAAAVASFRTLPSATLRRPVPREILVYSEHMLGTRFITYARDSLATFVIGGFLGATSAGYFRVGQRIVSSLVEVIAEPARIIGWVLFRKVGQEHEDLESPEAIAGFQRAMERAVPVLMAIALPCFIGLAIAAEPFLALLLGEEWRPAAIVTSMLAVGMMLLTPTAFTVPLLSVTGKIRYLPPISMLYSVLSLRLTLAVADFGIVAVAAATLVAALSKTRLLRRRHRFAGAYPDFATALRGGVRARSTRADMSAPSSMPSARSSVFRGSTGWCGTSRRWSRKAATSPRAKA